MRPFGTAILLFLTFLSAVRAEIVGKLFAVNPENRTFELLKETEYDPKTAIGRSRFSATWTENAVIRKVDEKKSFAGIKGQVWAKFQGIDEANRKAIAERKPFVARVATVMEGTTSAPQQIITDNEIAGWFTPGPGDAPRGGSISIDGAPVPVTLRGNNAKVVHYSPLVPAELARGFWQATLDAREENGRLVVDCLDAAPLPDPRLTDDPKLPRVLVIGDSISMNYHEAAKAALAGVANYHRNEGNASSSAHGVSNTELWLGNYHEKGFHWDAIQFNHGLHDLKQTYDAKTDTWGEYNIPLEDYKANLEKQIAILRKTGARLIWCATTPVPNDNKSQYARRKGASAIFNAAALEVIQRHPDILVTDLHAVVDNSPAFENWRKGIDVHFYQKEEQRLLGEAAAATIRKTLPAKPNILFLAIDDQNDWVGHLGGHPMVKTPHLDALAARGTTFLNAHCQAPICNPSRASALFGLRPTTTGIYGLKPAPRAVPAVRDRVSLPQYFAENGYRTYGTGKLFHMGISAGGKPVAPEFAVTAPLGGVGTVPPHKLIPPTPFGNHPLMDWGIWPTDNDDTGKGDYKVASWVADQIIAAPADQPFFIAAGFFLPHVPCYATQKWFDLYPDNDMVLPKVLDTDREDTPRFSWYMHWELPEPRLSWLKDNHQWRNLVRSYLASTSFTDAQIGRVMEALAKSGKADNTIVVVWSDHGWHLGEKGISGKNSLWDRSTRVPLIFAGPGVKSGQRCTQPAELLDMYPTLVELAGLDKRGDLDGLSLVPQLRDASTQRARPAITTHNQGNHGIRGERWRYIRYADGTEELYDMTADPCEWRNLAGKPEFQSVIDDHKRWLPKPDLPPAPGSAHRLLTYDSQTDTAVWEGKEIKRADPIRR